jgi:preprotein translocase subunit SecY
LALGLSIVYSIVYSTYIEYNQLFLSPGLGAKAIFVLSLTVGSLFTMWLGEQISLLGLGSGSSLIIFTGIVSSFPDYVARTVEWVRIGNMHLLLALFILVFFIAVIACIVFLEKGDRKIPVHYARRVIGQRVYGGQNTYIPFKINNVGVMPIIFASSVLNIPFFVFSFLAQRFDSFKWIVDLFKVNGLLYNILEFFLILFFTFFYLTLVYNPVELANDMKKQGGFVPGIRPGKQTADYFDYILTRIGLVGAFYLAMLALLPNILSAVVTMPFMLQGTSLLISVGVALEISALIESSLIEHDYGSFIKGSRLKSGVPR